MAEPLRHRQTKEAETDMFYLKPPRHISTLPISEVATRLIKVRSLAHSGLDLLMLSSSQFDRAAKLAAIGGCKSRQHKEIQPLLLLCPATERETDPLKAWK